MRQLAGSEECAGSNQSRALPLISSTPTRQRRALGARPGRAGVPTAHACAVGWRALAWLDPVSFWRAPRASPVMRSHNEYKIRVWPHNGLKTRPTYAQTKFRANPAKIAYTPRNHAQGLALSLRPSASRQPRRRVERPLSSRQRRRPDQLGRRGLDADGHRTDPAHNPWSVALLRRHGPFQ